MADTGAAFTLITTAAVKEFELEMRPYHATFNVANGGSARIVGEVDLIMQVHEEL